MTDPFEEISTARLRLVPIGESTARAIVAGDLSDLSPAEGWPHDDTLDGLRMALERAHPAGWLFVLEGTVIGDGGVFGPPDGDGVVEIGYGLAAPSRGRGYGSEAVAAMTVWLGRQPGVRNVRARTRLDNAASRRVLEKAGFALTGFEGEQLAVYEHTVGEGL